jgi:glycine cleavage system regulatory protein
VAAWPPGGPRVVYGQPMRVSLALTVIAGDRPGLVERLAATVAEHGANWEASHMARLAGQFAGILLVTIDAGAADGLVASLRGLDAHGLSVSVHPTQASSAPVGGRVMLDIVGADRPGIVRDVARVIAERGINVEELESDVSSAPMSGELLFRARALLRMPAGASPGDLRSRLEALANELMVEIEVGDG